MTKTDRLYKIEMLVRQRGIVSFADMLTALEISPATLKRDLEYLRDRLGAPIEYHRAGHGYRFALASTGDPGTASAATRHELPGLWFSEPELYALLMAQQLLSGLDAHGLLNRHLQPLLDRIHGLLGPQGETDATVLMQRVKVIGALRRPVAAQSFERVGAALMRRRRLQLRYLTRGRGETSEREVSPQRMVHYKNTWYLDAWCHSRERLLRFALDAVQDASVLDDQPAVELPLSQVQAEMDTGYGIYAGGERRWAVLRFSPQAAAWISHEEWHPEQQGRWCDDGSWELTLPYRDETELLMDVLRQGEQAEVIAPASLRLALQRRLAAAMAVYGADAGGAAAAL